MGSPAQEEGESAQAPLKAGCDLLALIYNHLEKMSTSAFIFRGKVHARLFKENYYEREEMGKTGSQMDTREDLPLCVKRVFLSYKEWNYWPGWEVTLQTKCELTK